MEKDIILCHTCVTAVHQHRILQSKHPDPLGLDAWTAESSLVIIILLLCLAFDILCYEALVLALSSVIHYTEDRLNVRPPTALGLHLHKQEL